MLEAKPVIVVAPDSFKGSLTARQAAMAMREGIGRALPNADVILCPMADGGEGTIDAILARGGEIFELPARGVDGVRKQVRTAILPEGAALIEAAEIVGLTSEEARKTPVANRSSLGLGDALSALIDRGFRRILIGIGGTSTNDAGAGMLHALGLQLLDAQGNPLQPTLAALHDVRRIDANGLDPRLQDVEIIVLSDVTNPLAGKSGATSIFGPQKGIRPIDIEMYDRDMVHFADALEQCLGRQAQFAAGAGAAGGLGFALKMIGATIQSGGDSVADLIGLDDALRRATWAITGEGRSDEQTIHGKVPHTVSRRAHQLGVATTLLSGSIDPRAFHALTPHFLGCFASSHGPIALASALQNAEKMLSDATEQLVHLWRGSR